MDIQLWKCCNHLFLLKNVEEEICKNVVTDEDYYSKVTESSGKIVLLNKLVEKYKSEKKKILVFSQFKQMLDIIQGLLNYKGIPTEILTGSIKS